MKSEQAGKVLRLNKLGSYELELSGNVIRFDGRGVVSDVDVKKYHEDIHSLMSEIRGEWGLLGLVGGVGILTPTAEEELVASIKQRKLYGMKGCALVVSQAVVPPLVQSQFERIYYASDLAFSFCNSEQEGLTWLESIGCFREL